MGIFSRSGNSNGSASTPEQFYSLCVKEFHEKAKSVDVAKKGVILIPELMKPGEKIVLGFLNDGFLQQEFAGNPAMFYYSVFMFCLDSGIAVANKWHKDVSSVDSYVDALLILGPADDANKLLQANFPKAISENQGNKFANLIFSRWAELVNPYVSMKDPRQYYFSALLAGYQLGVSMMLEKLGY